MEKAKKYFLVFGLLLGGVLGFYLTPWLEHLFKVELLLYQSAGVILFTAILVGVIFYFSGVPVATLVARGVVYLEEYVARMSLADIAVGAGGLIIGLIIANLLTSSLARIPIVGSFLPAVAMVLLGYIGVAVARSKKEDILALFPLRFRQQGKSSKGRKRDVSETTGSIPKILDTSTIIDGRIADICKTGFLEGPIIIPNFVLDELRKIADSSDNLKRNKGRRGLDVLNVLQKDVPIEITIQEWPTDPEQDVDLSLLKMAKAMGARIITTDFNLAKIAEFQDVGVLNINQLANSLKPMVSAGEELTIHILKEGKEPGQGVGYLEDGTMVVVEQAKKHIGDTITVTVTNCHTTPAGRMIFAKPKYLDRAVEEIG